MPFYFLQFNLLERLRRTQCLNNLKQIGLGIYLFHDSREEIVPSRLACNHATWACLLWPHIEEADVAGKWGKEQSYYFQPAENLAVQVQIYLCPTRRLPPQLSIEGDDRDGVQHRPGGLGDYAASIGDGVGYENDGGGDGVSEPNGAFRSGISPPCQGEGVLAKFPGTYKSRTSFKKITDGLSKTVFIGEKQLIEEGLGKKDFGDNSIYNPDYIRAFARYGGDKAPIGLSRDEPAISTNSNFGSWHEGVSNFLLGDASARTIANTIEPRTLGYLCNIHDSQILDMSTL